MNHWSSSATIGNFVQLQRGNTYKSSLLDTPGPYLLGLASISRDGGFRNDKLRTYGGETPEKIIVNPGDLYVSLKDVTQSGNLLGAVARVPNSITTGRMTQDTVKLIFINNIIDKSYFYWTLRTPEYRSYCRARGTGTTNLSLSRDDFLSFKIPKPSIEATTIAHTLDHIENMIETRRTTNETLEAMARTLFQAWFVDFEPVRAKMEGRWKRGQSLPGLPAHLYDLFPDRLIESEQGEIPKGWNTYTFGDVADQVKGSITPTNTPNETFFHYSLPAFDSQRLPATELGGSIKSNKTPVPNNSLLVSKLNPHIPRIWLIGDTGKNAVCSTEFIVWKPKHPANSAFLYCVASSEAFIASMTQLVTGTSNSHQRVKPEQLRSIQTFSANEQAIKAFSAISESIMEQTLGNLQRNQSLAQLRNTLLPRLMSGELRIPDAKRIAEEAL